MKKNVGGIDRIARFIVGPLLVVVGLAALGGLVTLAAGTLGVVVAALALLLGAVFTATAATQKCPINSLLGLNTYRAGDVESSGEERRTEPRAN